MPLWATLSLIIIAAVATALWAAQSLQARAVAAAVAGLLARAQEQPSQARATHFLEELPLPVLRYLNHALPADRRGLKFVRYEQSGTLRTDPMRDNWIKFIASQVISPRRTEFLWTARASIAPLLHVRVRDSYIGGLGAGRVLFLSAIPIASASGNIEINSGSLHRFLAEAVWCPSALMPSAQLTWSPVDDHRAIAALTDGATTVSLEFRFSSENEVISIYTPGRWGSFDGTYKQVAWEGKFHRYSANRALKDNVARIKRLRVA